MAYADEIRTAQQVLASESDHDAQTDLREEAIAAAEADGVTRSEYINYEAKLANYEARADVEPLAERRARDIGDSFTAAQFRREGTGSYAVFTSPADQNVDGLVDENGAPLDTPGTTTTP